LEGEVLPSEEDAKIFFEFAQSVAKIAKAEIQLAGDQ